MKNFKFTFSALALLSGHFLVGCSQTVQEKIVDTTPGWYLKIPSDDGMIYGAGMSTSPDLQFSVDKALLQAKSVLADRLKGQTSVLARSYVTQRGNLVVRSDDKTTKSQARDVSLAGYEIVNQAIVPDAGTYRAYVLVRYTPASGSADDLDKAVGKMEVSPVAKETPIVQAAPVVVAPSLSPDDAPPAPSAAPVERAIRENIREEL